MHMLIKLYAIAFPAFLVLDAAWLSLAKGFYAGQVGSLMKTSVNWTAAIAFYLLFVLGLVIFAIAPAMEKSSLTHAVFSGALFGLVSYATYDLTNLAVAKGWTIPVTIVDMAWGTALSAAVSLIAYSLAHRIGL